MLTITVRLDEKRSTTTLMTIANVQSLCPGPPCSGCCGPSGRTLDAYAMCPMSGGMDIQLCFRSS